MPLARRCFAALALADALSPLSLGFRCAHDAPARGCFAALASLPSCTLLGGCFATTALSSLLAVFCVVFFFVGPVG